ncbi:helix-turn-helix domain-containing protein, partial [Marinobacter alexandrii]|uniref:helix-turn-helix domain-containing protein n=1 Tax=Marinobacter alexandrii TaxID=2570351 RepID=UPI003298BB86
MNTPRLSIIPALAATDAHIKPRDLQLLCVLGRHTDDGGWCRRSQVKMSREMGCSRATVYNAVERLVKRGYLERHIIETESGRDSAHLYRVVLDPDLEDLSTVQPEETVAETDADPPCHYSGTPASILAPPASPGVAPPASSGVAPMLTTPLNDPLLTEREGAGADEQEPEPEKPVVTKDTWRRRLRKAHADWPTYAADSPQKTEIEWFRLCDADRDTAVSHLGAYLQHVGGLGRSRICAFSVYLQEK